MPRDLVKKDKAAQAALQAPAPKGTDKSAFKQVGYDAGSAMLQPTSAMGGHRLPQASDAPGPQVPAGGMPQLPDTPGPQVPAGGMPHLPDTPAPQVPAGGMPALPDLPGAEKQKPEEKQKAPADDAKKAPGVGTHRLPKLPQQPDPKVPAGGMPKLPGVPDPKVPAGGMPKLPMNPDEKAAAAEKAKQEEAKKKEEEEKRKKEERDKLVKRSQQKWYVEGMDDAAAVTYCSVDKEAAPDKLATYRTYAEGMVNVLKFKPVYARYKHLSDKDIANVILYTTNAAYPMNAILRGQLKSPKWMESYGALSRDVTKSLAKFPKGVKNEQGNDDAGKKRVLDESKGDDKIVPIGNVYRNDAWSAFFDPVFADTFKVGRALEEPGFFSATVVKDSYLPGAPVKRTIEGAKVSRSLEDVSAVNTEREALFPPNQRFQITGIELEDQQKGTRFAVADPQATFPKKDASSQAFNRPGRIWHVKLKHVGVAKGKKKEKPEDKTKKQKTDDGSKAPGPLEKLLGIG